MCCSECNQADVKEATCSNPTDPNASGECPVSRVDEACISSRQCTDYRAGVACILGKCRKTYGAYCDDSSQCFGAFQDKLACIDNRCTVPEGGKCDPKNRGSCVRGTTCVAAEPGSDYSCSRGPGDPCEPGKSKCVSNGQVPLVCSENEKKCMYTFRGACYDDKLCIRPDGLQPNATVKCIEDPFHSHRRGADNSKCLPMLPPGVQCNSDTDCLRGPCKDGICPGESIQAGGDCNIYNDKCASPNVCHTNPNDADHLKHASICIFGAGSSCEPGVTKCPDSPAGFRTTCSRKQKKCVYRPGSRCKSNNCEQPETLKPGQAYRCLPNKHGYERVCRLLGGGTGGR